jgi:hypothetical protein
MTKQEVDNALKDIADVFGYQRDEIARLTYQLSQYDILITSIQDERDELLAAAKAIEINAEECLDWDDCTAMLVPIGDYHKLIAAIASVKGE